MLRSNPMRAADISEIRAFNRFYTRQLGLLDRGLLGSEFTLTECRVLYELANRERCRASDIAADLGLDSGYLSRMLKKFERRHFIERRRSVADGRQSWLRLTKRGLAAFRPLNRAAVSQLATMTREVAPAEQRQLVDAMQTIRRVLKPDEQESEAVPYTLRPLRTGDIGWITHRQGLLYAQEYGWDQSYEALVAEILAAFVKCFDAGYENAWVAERNGTVVGSVFLVRSSATVAKLRLLYVEPGARGLGIGRELVHACIGFARSKDYRVLSLWTNDVLVSARRIYEAAGFRLTQQEPHHSFGKDLMGQTWELELGATVRTTP
ncbi:MAG: helix-turn-helix domain-containing GNAT family N-acetyltransferase [Steroidobacteraceae bacterium]